MGHIQKFGCKYKSIATLAKTAWVLQPILQHILLLSISLRNDTQVGFSTLKLQPTLAKILDLQCFSFKKGQTNNKDRQTVLHNDATRTGFHIYQHVRQNI